MSDEAVVAAQPEVPEAAPDTSATAAPVESPVAGEGEKPETTKPSKTFTQEDVDRIVAKEKARAERKVERDIDRRIAEALQKQQPKPETTEAPQKPKPDQFATTEEYVEAVAAWKADELFNSRVEAMERESRERRQRTYQEKVLTTFREREQAAREKYPDFEEVAYDPSVPITPAMASTIQESELGAEMAYFLGKNPKEADRIARLSPFLQAKELGRLEAKIADQPPPAKPSAAPPPINPLNSARAGSAPIDTTDPKSLDRLGTSAWIEAERRRQAEKWERERR